MSAKTLTPPVSLGNASDLVVALRCTVGGPSLRFEEDVDAPLWVPPNVSYATVDSEDKSIVWVEAARVTEDLRLECQFASDSRTEKQEVRFSQGVCMCV